MLLKNKLMIVIVLLLCFLPNHAALAEEINESKTVIFYVSHQDDELLTMGSSIVHYVQRGYDVHLVLLTDGASSKAINTVNKRLNEEAFSPLTVNDFSRARFREFVESAKALGIKRRNMHFEYMRDGATNAGEIEKVIRRFKAEFPAAEHTAFSYHDDHIDHRNSGLALLNLYNLGMLSETKFYIQNVERHLWPGEYEDYHSSYDTFIERAILAYSLWDPAYKRYAIGNTSVSYDFKKLLEDPRGKYHYPNQ
ncbi:PIG-L family deacetylase [Mesobacillus selenatarsenatis]|uniref:LmbE family protein n=1 Tax=Mesobacillus selenatarsenatis (strain DSM 18680 / JCM 14380 / FERM P-15431 / SF-1) TaxID=1321606 RepID=A0A0A8WYI8_MESS1|nr:PIG-L family deacetylase [Mesobacillus selenatarsenatis]GAM12019.1 hypothetical protein SAMD00020551_0138 [Mesobacillus selenatarsenatis SF-1]